MSRKNTDRILEMVELGLLDKDYLISACLQYMSEDDVADMARSNDIEIEEQYDPDLLDDDTEEEEDKCESCETELHGNDVKLCASCANDAMDEDCIGDWYDTSNEFL